MTHAYKLQKAEVRRWQVLVQPGLLRENLPQNTEAICPSLVPQVSMLEVLRVESREEPRPLLILSSPVLNAVPGSEVNGREEGSGSSRGGRSVGFSWLRPET